MAGVHGSGFTGKTVRTDGAEDGSDVEAAGSQHREVTESENYRIAFEDEETVQWGDAEDKEEEPDWDFLDLRRRSSVLSGALRAARGRRVSVLQPRQPGGRVTMAAQTKFIQPPLFAGKEEEDVTEWMDRYEKIGNYNRWGDAEKRAHVELSLTGAAQKWFSYKGKAGQLATDWGTAAGPPVVIGLKDQILRQFTPANRDQYNETRLRERKQGPEESTVEFFYDVLDLCGKVDPNMAEQVKLQHLWRGIKPSLVEKFWSMKPATTDEFLTEVKRYQEMTSKSRHEEWAMGMLGKQMPPVENDRLDRLEKMFEVLMGAIGTKETEKPQKKRGNQDDSGQRPWFQWAPQCEEDEAGGRTEERSWSRGAETSREITGGGRAGRGGGST